MKPLLSFSPLILMTPIDPLVILLYNKYNVALLIQYLKGYILDLLKMYFIDQHAFLLFRCP